MLNFGPGEWLFEKLLCRKPKLYDGAMFFRLSCCCALPTIDAAVFQFFVQSLT